MDGDGFGSRPSAVGGRRDAIFNHGIKPQLQIMDRLGDMTGAAFSENLRIPLAADGREICLRFISKGYCVRSCTRSHTPVQVHNRDLVIRYIRVAREAMNQSQKRKFDGSEDQGSQGGHWDSSGGHGQRNSEGQHHGNSARLGGGRGGHLGGRDGNNSGGGGVQGGHGSNINPPHQDGQKNRGGGQNYWEGGRSA